MTEDLRQASGPGKTDVLPTGVNRSGVRHDHIHLLANELPLLFGYAMRRRKKRCRSLWKSAARVPAVSHLLSARIQGLYRFGNQECPGDLCAAGRYWCWDFAYWVSQGRRDMLEQQLLAVCRQARLDDYLMGERYDMNYIFYQDDKTGTAPPTIMNIPAYLSGT